MMLKQNVAEQSSQPPGKHGKRLIKADRRIANRNEMRRLSAFFLYMGPFELLWRVVCCLCLFTFGRKGFMNGSEIQNK